MRRQWAPLAVFAFGLWLANTSLFITPDPAATQLLAHRGVHQTYTGPDPGTETCTAAPIAPPRHPFIENTIPSMAAAFEAGADVVELDVHLTPDGRFAVFHDWTLDCRTDGTGQTNQTPFTQIQTLDAGWGYATADGQTPLRGTAIGAIPSLTDVLTTFPDGQFLINFKSNNAQEGTELAALLQNLPQGSAQVFGVYGGGQPIESFRTTYPDIPGFTFDSVKRCLLWYTAFGWAGYVPGACQQTQVMVPISHARLIWGWPHRFTKRMESAGTEVILVGPWNGGSTRGIDTPEDVARVPFGFAGYVWTDEILAVTPSLAARSD